MTRDELLDFIVEYPEVSTDQLFKAITILKSNRQEVNVDNLKEKLKKLGVVFREVRDYGYRFDYVDKKFLEKYIVSNFWLPKDIGSGIPYRYIQPFKQYLLNVASHGLFNQEIEKIYKEFLESIEDR